MTYEELRKVNESINLVDIKGKSYAQVNERIKAFRQLFPNGSIIPKQLKDENGVCTYEVEVRDGEGRLLSVGHANEKESSSYINKTSYIENCETSAVGRALGFLGIGIDLGIASAEEVENAAEKQQPPIFEAQAQFNEKVTYLQNKKRMSLDEIGLAIGVTNEPGVKSLIQSFEKLVAMDRALYDLCAEKSK